jgi:hypothetical protein
LTLGAVVIRCCIQKSLTSVSVTRRGDEPDTRPQQVLERGAQLGYPMPWAAISQTVARANSTAPEDWGVPVFIGVNPGLPVGFAVLAICLPPAIVGFLGRRRISPARWIKSCWVLTPAALVGLTGSWIGNELWATWQTPFERSLSELWPRGDSLRSRYLAQVDPVQNFVWRYFLSAGRYTDDDWSSRIRWTTILMLGTAAGGCLVIRPWRRVPVEPQSSAAAPTTRTDL